MGTGETKHLKQSLKRNGNEGVKTTVLTVWKNWESDKSKEVDKEDANVVFSFFYDYLVHVQTCSLLNTFRLKIKIQFLELLIPKQRSFKIGWMICLAKVLLFLDHC
eukprot:TRINITY_DN2968_c0_g1_i7.p1 TRINITY_DN2968_c0_g1~~TRINITY_DN2968_c0_g1_i7.p1  ORF type:complete len:106 (-),score=19.46 TRINITY_DN2968_c0_g1_i7:163-480(-)